MEVEEKESQDGLQQYYVTKIEELQVWKYDVFFKYFSLYADLAKVAHWADMQQYIKTHKNILNLIYNMKKSRYQ